LAVPVLVSRLAAGQMASAQESAPRFADRLDPSALDAVIAQLTAATAQSPLDAEPRLRLARAESFWAELHAEAGAQNQELIGHLSTGVEAAREALRLVSPGYAAAVRESRALPEALQAIEPAGAVALYWIAADQHQLAAQRGLAALLLEDEDLRHLFARVIQLAPGTFHGGAYLHEAELALAVPAGYAASLETAKNELTQAAGFGAGWLQIDLVWAERWAVKAQDYGLFKRKLERVLESRADVDPDLIPENELAKRRAKALVASSQVLFTRAAIQRGEGTARAQHQR
jgi:hypothetical protein